MKALPFFLLLLGGAYAAEPISNASCTASTDFCASEWDFKESKSVYTTPDHQNVQLNIHNPSNPGDTKNMYLQAYGKDANNRINVNGDIYLNVPYKPNPANPNKSLSQKSELGIDFKYANYYGNINFIKDIKDGLSYNSPLTNLKMSFDTVNFNGNINLANYKLNENSNAITFKNSTLNGNLYIKAYSTTGLDFDHSVFNGNITFYFDRDAAFTGQYFTFNGSTFNNSKITLGFLPGLEVSNFNTSVLGYYPTINNNVFNNTTLDFEFPKGNIIFKNNTFNGGTIILNNKAPSSIPGNTNNSFDSKGSDIRANIIVNGDGTQVTKTTMTYTEKTDPNPQYHDETTISATGVDIYWDQKPTNCPGGDTKGSCWTEHTPGTSTLRVDSTGKTMTGNVVKTTKVYTPRSYDTYKTFHLGMDFTFESLASTDSDNASGVDKTSSFQGNISLSGGGNNFTIKDKTKMKQGTLSINGGTNTFNISDNSSFDHFNIEISRLLKDYSQIPDDDRTNWENCTEGSLCYQDPTNTFNITNSSFTNSSFTIIGGKSNTFNFSSSSFTDGDIRILGGKKNTLNFKDTPKIGGDILISGGSENTLSFSNTTLSESTKKLISANPSTSSLSSSGNPFDPASMTIVKSAIITGKMTPDFISMLNNTPADLFKGNLTLGSSSASDTMNSISFQNGAILGDILIENGNALNIKKVTSSISMDTNLFLGDIKSNGNGMTTQTTLKNSAMVGNIETFQGINYTSLDNSELYGNITTQGGTNITQIKNGSVFAGSMNTYDGMNFVDLNMSLYTNQNGEISRINTYGGESNITLSINAAIAQVLTSQKIYPVFHIGNYNGGKANIAVEGPVSGTAQVDYSGGTANIIFADGFDSSVKNDFFANGTECATITDACIKSGEALIDPKNPTKQVFKINGYTYQDGLAITLDAAKADRILSPFRNIYEKNYASIFLDKSGVSPSGVKDNIYRMKINGVIVGAEYNLPSSSDKQYEVTFGENSAFIGEMFAKTDNTNFILSQGSKLVLDGGSNSVISKLSSNQNFTADIDTMFEATLGQKNNTIIDLATSGEQVTRAFQKNTFSTMHILEMDNFNNAIFRVGIDASKTDSTLNINKIPNNTDRIIISDVATGQHLSDYLQVYQDYNHLITGDLSDKNILVAVIENSPKPNTSMVFDTSASNVQQGYDQVSTILTTKPVKVDRKADGSGTGSIDINPDAKDANAMGYFIQSAATQVDPRSLADTNSAITSNYSIFLANINNLNKRMGELRDNSYAQGAWSRVFSGLNSSARGDDSKIYSNNIQFGYDYGWNTNVGEQFLGGAFTYGYDSIKGNAYNGSANVLEFAGYYSWVGTQGFFTDTIVKYTYIRNRISLKDNANYNVPLNSNGGSIGQELGYRYYTNKDKTLYIEPSGEVILGLMNGGVINQVSQSGLMQNNDFVATLNTDLNYIFNFRGKVGANLGYRLKTDKNQTDFRIGAFYVADIVNGGVINYKTNYSSAQTLIEPNQQLMINLGLNSIVSENWRVYADIDSGFLGTYFNQNYLVSVGLRYEFGHALNPLAAKLAEEKRIKNIKLYTQRLDEGIARVKLKQDRIRQSEIFEKEKADVIATAQAKQEANIAIRKKERTLDTAKFKTLTLAIAKVINEALPDSELQKFQAQEIKVLEDAKNRVNKNIEGDAELNRKNNETQHSKQIKELQTRQPQQLKELEEKQAKNKKDMLDAQAQTKQNYVEKQAKEKQDLIAKNAQELKDVKAQDKAKIQAKQQQQLKELEEKQAKDMKVFSDRASKDIKELEEKQAKAIANLKNKQLQEAQELKARQEKENKIVEDFIAKQEKESSAYLQKIEQELKARQIRDKKALEEAQKKALSLQIKKAMDDGVSDAEFQKLQDQESAEFQSNKLNATEDIQNRANENTKQLKNKHAQQLKDFEKNQSEQFKEFSDKQAKEKKDLLDKQSKTKEEFVKSQEREIKKADTKTKAKLQTSQNKALQNFNAKQAKEIKDLQTSQTKALNDFRAKQAKEKKDLLDKQSKETKNLQTSIAKEKKDNEEYWKNATKALEAKQNKDKKDIQRMQKNSQNKVSKELKSANKTKKEIPQKKKK
ncbi:autotransporter outer membrane beta-barrel domain-containing protein [Helicobacter cappadocius]|uniref:Autotransporter outer membrane beta-barrel domain-containing protein n=1 Tax=Helicobacter cappadocius TaxID=3063998 RepID=A0ABT8Z316_9HELI|nr:autotransporter outer membrane beta-barrel domain-containing protein [Helicobacter sp. faydin-H75]MDO7252913.1 autotransporter outer membrane beta-barrel domain-containing protein [Helicobacter sp. faydin-H75]